MSRFRRFPAIAAALVVVLLMAGGVWWRLSADDEGDSDSAEAEGPAPETSATGAFSTDVPIPVEGVPATRDTLVLRVSAAAQAAPWREATLPAHQAGQVASVPVRESQAVSQGAVIAVIDPTEYEMALREAESQLESARATFRELTLFDDRISDTETRAERGRVARAKSGLDAAEVRVERARLDLARTRVVAPFAGRVASIESQQGEWVRAGDPLMRVVDLDPIRVEVQVLDGEVGYLRQGGRAEVRFSAFPGEVFAGRIATVNPVVDPELRTARVTVLVPNPDGRVLPGMYARVSLEAREFPDRLLVPRSAILERDRRNMLFVYEGDDRGGLAKWRYVTTGLGNDQWVEIVEGEGTELVEPGEVVLTDGHYSLIHDARVRLVDDLDGAEQGRPE